MGRCGNNVKGYLPLKVDSLWDGRVRSPKITTILAAKVRQSFRDVPVPGTLTSLSEDQDFESALVADTFRENTGARRGLRK
jgi:hypothetical protein